MYMFGVAGETHAHDYFEVIYYNNIMNLYIAHVIAWKYVHACAYGIIANIYNIIWYNSKDIEHSPICHSPYTIRHMCNLHIKETEISQKRCKEIKNWKITYSVILTDLSNKTNFILGYRYPLTYLTKDFDLNRAVPPHFNFVIWNTGVLTLVHQTHLAYCERPGFTAIDECPVMI